MATNDFLPFAGGAGANVLAQADYAELTALVSGFTTGILPSKDLNKALRQATVMAAVLGQFIADNAGDNVVDDGTTATIEASLMTALGVSLLGAGGASSADYLMVPYRDKTTGARQSLIVQWGQIQTNGTTTKVVTFPIAFPSGLLADAVIPPDNNLIAGQGATATQRTYTTKTVAGAASSAGITFNYIAIGH